MAQDKGAALAELMKQKRMIEAQIKQLKSNIDIVGKVKFEKKEGEDEYRWQVSALSKYTFAVYEREKVESPIRGYICKNTRQVGSYEKERWSPFIREKTKEDMLKQIDVISDDLHKLSIRLAFTKDNTEAETVTEVE